jgi:hypothetical protein
MVARVSTVAFQGIEGVPVDVQVMVAPGKVGMQIVGLPDKAVAESRWQKAASGSRRRCMHPACRCPPRRSPSILPRPIFRRRDAIYVRLVGSPRRWLKLKTSGSPNTASR